MKFYCDFFLYTQVFSYEVEARDFTEANNIASAFLAGTDFYSPQKAEGRVLSINTKAIRGHKYYHLGDKEFKK